MGKLLFPVRPMPVATGERPDRTGSLNKREMLSHGLASHFR
jgi:hypothetical protein